MLTRLLVLVTVVGGVRAQDACAQNQRFARSPAAFERDQKRLASTPMITSLGALLASQSVLVGRRPTVGNLTTLDEGTNRFRADLGHGCAATGTVQHYGLPMLEVSRLRDLSLERAGQRLQLLDGKLPVSIRFQTAFYYEEGGYVAWHGPVSTFSLLALFHELDHLGQYRAMDSVERRTFRQIYDRKDDGLALRPGQQRLMVGFERHAWSAALRKMRQLRRQGFDLLAGVPFRELRQTIDGCLKGYYEYRGKQQP